MEFFDRLLQQHRYILDLTKTLGTEADAESRKKTLDRLESEFELHCFLHESCIYPVLERFESAENRSAVLWENHNALRGTIQSLREGLERDVPWGIRVGAIIEALETHFEDEQTHVLADLRRVASEEALLELEGRLEYAEQQQRSKRAA